MKRDGGSTMTEIIRSISKFVDVYVNKGITDSEIILQKFLEQNDFKKSFLNEDSSPNIERIKQSVLVYVKQHEEGKRKKTKIRETIIS